MPKLIDELRRNDARVAVPFLIKREMEDLWRRRTTEAVGLLRNPELPVLVVDNVAEYFYQGTDQENWDLRQDFPNLAPPYPQFWIEHRMVKRIHSKQCGDTDLSRLLPLGGRIGMLFTAFDPQQVDMVEVPEETKWALSIELFIDYGQRQFTVTGTHGSILLCIDSEGKITHTPWIQSMAEDNDAPVMQALVSWLHPALLAISFLHCQNVTVVDNPVPPKLQRRYQQRHQGARLTAHKTLVIEPLKAILRNQGRSGQVGLAKAMHICRGHFRDYREGKGLFGKYHKLVWTPAVVRGTKGSQASPREIEIKI